MHVFIVVKYAEHEINHFSRFYRHSGITCIHTFSKNRLPLFLLLLQAFCFRLCWVFLAASRLAAAVALRRLVAAASGCGAGSPAPARRLGLASSGSQALSSGAGAVAHGLRCSEAHAPFPDQASSPCAPHWQVGSHPPLH